MRINIRYALAALAFLAGAFPSQAADVSTGYTQGPGGYYSQVDRSGPYTISAAGVVTLIGQITGATINSTAGPTVSEVTLIDKSTGGVVIRRTIIYPNGTISTVFVDLAGNTLNPVIANLVPPGMGSGTPIALAALSLSPLTATVGNIYTAAISGLTASSSVSATSSDGTVLSVSNGGISGTFSAAGNPTVSVTETLGGATGSPKVSTFVVAVTTPPSTTTGLTASLLDPTFIAAVLH